MAGCDGEPDLGTRSEHQQRIDEVCRNQGGTLPDSPTVIPVYTRKRMSELVLSAAFELIENGLGLDMRVHPEELTPEDGLCLVQACDLSVCEGRRSMDLGELLDCCCNLRAAATLILSKCGLADELPQLEFDRQALEVSQSGHYTANDVASTDVIAGMEAADDRSDEAAG